MHGGPLGTLAWFIGGVLWELVYDGVVDGSEQDRLNAIWEAIVREYEVQGTKNRLSMLPLRLFYHGNSAWTCFGGKAGETWSLLYLLHEVCIEHCDGSERDLHRVAASESICDVFRTRQMQDMC